ncbi:MAG: hypothetical protein JWL83_1692, partial [Actinomycetia bacterium]|nr:hypothetical protein [Actinomycetes bacterium]
VQAKVRVHRGSPVAIERNGRLGRDPRDVVLSHRRCVQAAQPQRTFGTQVEARLRRDEQPEIGAGCEETLEIGRRGHQMFEVVEHEHVVTTVQLMREHVEAGNSRKLADTKRGRDRRDHELGVRHSRQRDEQARVRVSLVAHPDRLEGEARLANPTAAGNRHKAAVRVPKHCEDLIEFVGARDEWRVWLVDLCSGSDAGPVDGHRASQARMRRL